MKIKNLEQLRNHALETLEKLSSGLITIEEAGATSKLCENVVSTLKIELDFAKMVGKAPSANFIGDSSKWQDIPKKLPMLKEDK